ncbi:TPA: PLP-dependent aminotransferase family protein, partial [Candidatus Bipolaricaulota bacterium]|nr:PLP-dependent aminotransferase family protein [Candidatus Bipolaricaulota bacterium]
QSFTAFQAEKVGIPQREDGMDLEILEEKIEEALSQGKRPKLIYLVPDFHNPTGITMSLAKRRKVLKLAERYDLIIVEDDPYGRLRFEGEPLPLIKSLDRTGRVILIMTFSKTLCPGLRLAVIVASKGIISEVVKLKQPADLCTSPLSQRLAYEFITRYDFEAHIRRIREIYRLKRDTMLEALEQYMPKHPEIRWTRPQGGLFIWLTLPEGLDTQEMFPRAIERNVAYVVGSAFFVDGSGHNTMRLAFSEPTPELIREGIKRLGEVIEEELTHIGEAVAVK